MYGKLALAMFKVGLFTIGGGLASLPLLKELAVGGGWIDGQQFLDMLAVSQSTPGPIGINIATYIGYNQIGVMGAILATMSVILPSYLITSIIAATIPDFNSRPLVSRAMSGFRATALGLIAAATWFVLSKAVTVNAPAANPSETVHDASSWWQQINLISLGVFACIAIAYWKLRWHPAIFIVAGAVAGLILF